MILFPLFLTAVHRCSSNAVQSYSDELALALKFGAKHKLIGLDGSGGAQTVVTQVALRTWPAGSEAFIVALDENGKATEEMKVRELIAVAEEDLRAVAGLHVSSKIAEGDWERVLIAGARRIGADCIFVSSGNSMNDHNPGRPGIVSAALLKGAPCSVEVVRQQQAGH